MRHEQSDMEMIFYHIVVRLAGAAVFVLDSVLNLSAEDAEVHVAKRTLGTRFAPADHHVFRHPLHEGTFRL
jgi:hypothetical protein